MGTSFLQAQSIKMVLVCTKANNVTNVLLMIVDRGPNGRSLGF